MKNAARVVLSVLALSACGKDVPGPPSGAPALVDGPVVYGADGRLDWYAIDDAALKAQARDSVAAMIPWEYLSSDETGAVAVYGEPSLGETYGLCADQRFRDQPTAAMCSGTLIDDTLLLTAGHCVPNLSDCASSAWVFDYLYEADGVRATIDEDAVYRCVDVVVRPEVDLDSDIDLAIIQLDRPVVGRVPARVNTAPALGRGSSVILAGYPNGIPLKVDAGGLVTTARAEQGDYFVASIDAFYGNSGSGVLGADLAVLGVLVSGADDYADAGTCAIVSTLDPDEAEEAVMYANQATTVLCARGFPSATLCPESAGPTCGDGFCTDNESARTCRGDCDELFAVPAEWTCDPSWYDAGDDCDCACGVADPDCRDSRLDVVNCAPGSKCNADGTCAEPIPEAWVCPTFFYGDGEICNCDCGAPDPDCGLAGVDQSGCAPGGVCQEDGTCTISLPEGWDCRRRFYGTGDGCDCNCGAWDPDCDSPDAQVYGCVVGSACLEDGSCEVPVPAEWVCGAATYGAGDECDCNCGVPDPDCETSSGVRNCQRGEACDAEGRCVERVAEPDPEPGPEPSPEESPEVAEEVAEEIAEPDVVEPEADVDDAVEDPDDDARDADTSGPETDATDASGDTATRGVAARGDGCAGGGGAELSALALLAFAIARRSRRARA